MATLFKHFGGGDTLDVLGKKKPFPQISLLSVNQYKSVHNCNALLGPFASVHYDRMKADPGSLTLRKLVHAIYRDF